jgi:hypothetical protein
MTGPTAQALRALADGPKTNAELQDAIWLDNSSITRIMISQRQLGNVTRTDGATGKGTIATYALTTRGMLKASLTKIKEDAE